MDHNGVAGNLSKREDVTDDGIVVLDASKGLVHILIGRVERGQTEAISYSLD